jgi:hypothetical protein
MTLTAGAGAERDLAEVSFEVVHDAGGPRVGRFATAHGTIATPAFLPASRAGSARS